MSRKIPYSLYSEKQIIVTLMRHPETIDDIYDLLKVEHFFEQSHRFLFTHIIDMHKANKIITEETLTDEIAKGEVFFDVISFFFNGYGSKLELNKYVSLVIESYKRRELLDKIGHLTELLHQEKPHEEILDEVDKGLFSITVRDKLYKTPGTRIQEAFNLQQQRFAGHGIVKTGFKDLDSMTTGFLPGQLIVLGARTSIGKTSFALSLCHNIMNRGQRILFLSLEMPCHEIIFKSLSIDSKVPYRQIINGEFRKDTASHQSIIKTAKRVEQLPFEMEDDLYALGAIKSYCRKIKKDKNIQFVVIDYLGLIQTEKYSDNKLQQIGEITRSLKMLAKELNVPIFLLSQLNRKTESREDHMPH